MCNIAATPLSRHCAIKGGSLQTYLTSHIMAKDLQKYALECLGNIAANEMNHEQIVSRGLEMH